MAPQILSQAILKECFTYEAETGVLRWKVRPLSHFAIERIGKMWNTKFSLREAGVVSTSDGYRVAAVFGRRYQAHRLIWLLVHGIVPKEIDHIDHDRANNRLSNLREVSSEGNSKNMSLRSDNASGVTGVCWDKYRNKWAAEIRADGKHKHLGRFSDKADAIAARQAANEKFGFHPNHGR